jgi:hypothetical protein
MTAIVGTVYNGRVHLGGDSAGVSGWSLTIRADEKVFRNGPYVLGFTDSFRMGQLLRHAFVPPTPTGDLPKFMATGFIDAVRDTLKAGGFAAKESEREVGGNFLVGIAGRLFEVYSDYQVAETATGYAATGCGFELALGSLHATDRAGFPPRKRLEMALAAAEAFSAGVRGPFAFVSTRKPRA